jgi:hypothetical protein
LRYEKSATICRAALQREALQLVRIGNTISWGYRDRLFSAAVVQWLIANGEAVRMGDEMESDDVK